MPISHCEQMSLTCPSCGEAFRAELWLIVDAGEHPELLPELRAGRLHAITCPHCGYQGTSSAPFFWHDASTRTVIFAIPRGTPEHIWREQAHDLHAILVGSIDIEARRPYLGDVQVAQDMAGVAHLLDKAARRRARELPPAEPAAADAEPTRTPEVSETVASDAPAVPAVPAAPAIDPQQLWQAVEALLQSNDTAAAEATVQRFPLLLAPEADSALAQLATVAQDERQPDLAAALHEARQLLLRMRDGAGPESSVPAAPPAAPPADAPLLSPELYRALLQAGSSPELKRLVAQHPVLLAPWVDEVLIESINALLDEGNEGLALALEQCREELGALRDPAATDEPAAQPAAQPAELLHEAVEVLLSAEDEETIGQVLIEYPVLLTDDAQQALWQLSSEARTHGDDELAVYAVECRAMLSRVREGLAHDTR